MKVDLDELEELCETMEHADACREVLRLRGELESRGAGSRPDACPKCNSEDSIDSLDSDTLPTTHIEQWTCGACDAQWEVYYKFEKVVMRGE